MQLKRAVTILLCVSLYAPHMAKLMAFVDCSYVLLSNQSPILCDCNRIVDADMIPVAPDNPDKQKELSLKADWKYMSEIPFKMNLLQAGLSATGAEYRPAFIPQASLRSIFHPPRA